jgi:hypothetical protein
MQAGLTWVPPTPSPGLLSQLLLPSSFGFFFVLVWFRVLRMEPIVSYMLAKGSATELHTYILVLVFCFVASL